MLSFFLKFILDNLDISL